MDYGLFSHFFLNNYKVNISNRSRLDVVNTTDYNIMTFN